MNNRRSFLKNSCAFCLAVAGGSAIVTLLDSCKTSSAVFQAEMHQKTMLIPLLQMQDKQLQVIRNKNLEYDILLVKEGEQNFHALEMKCTHQQNPLVVTGTGLLCNLHGSRFDLDGNVTKEPATKPLKRYNVTVEDNNIVIYI